MKLNWDEIRLFYYVASLGTFSKAAQVLQVNQSSISRRISNLEYRVRKPLFIRNTKGVILTDYGCFLFQHAKNMYLAYKEMDSFSYENTLSSLKEIIIGTYEGYISTTLIEKLVPFIQSNQHLKYKLLSEDRNWDVLSKEADILIRPDMPHSHRIKKIYLYDIEYGLYASKSYLENRGVPVHISDLETHNLISYKRSDEAYPYIELEWFLDLPSTEKRKEPYIICSSMNTLFRLIEKGCGIAPFNKDSYLVQNQSIIQILPESALLKIPIYLFVPDKIKNDNLIKDIIGYLKNIYSESSRRRIQE